MQGTFQYGVGNAGAHILQGDRNACRFSFEMSKNDLNLLVLLWTLDQDVMEAEEVVIGSPSELL